MPDSSIMLELCSELKISVNELLSGEMIDMKEYDKKTDELLIEMAKQEEIKNRRLMENMWVLLITTLIFYVGIISLACFTLQEGPILGTIICVSTIVTVVVAFYGLKLEIDAGYYECTKCHHRYVPNSYFKAMFAPHMNTTRYMKCPGCNKRAWAKKVMTKE